ncbi:hypothetical protein [uncultured Coprobacter sp.]|uniref:hypothetical protein n=1 Tax=uncultured Coprobacter sp. TaxID=1720550 RepID=UPI002598ACEC|nr:hypothetical protein [uncultured Coprobacter sp.]
MPIYSHSKRGTGAENRARFFFHERQVDFYAGEKEAKSLMITFSMSEQKGSGEKVTKSL